MRTTLDIDEDVLLAAKSVSRQRGVSTGKALSELARRGLQREGGGMRHGVPLFQVRPNAPVVTLELVNRLREETP